MTALERHTPAYFRANLALFAAGFATFSAIYSVQPLMPEFSRVFGVSAAVSSLSLSVTTVVLAITLFVAGLASGAIERKTIMLVSMLASGTLSLVVAAAPGWPALLAIRAVQGVALGGVPALAIAYLSEEVRAEDLGAATGLYIAGTAVGGMGGRVISGVLADLFNWRVAIAALGVIALIASVVFLRLLPPSRNFIAQRGLTFRQHAGPLVQHLRHPALPWVFFCGFLFMGAFVTLYNYLAFRLSEAPFSLGQGGIGAVFVVYLLGIVTSAVAGRLADRYGRPPLLITAVLLMALGLGLTWPDSLALIILGTGLVTIGFFTGHSTASGWVGLLAGRGKGHAAGLYLLAYYLGSSFIGSVGGFFWSDLGWAGVTLLIGVLLLSALLTAVHLAAWHKRTH